MNIENGRWVPGIGDPTIIGWVTVAVYFIVAIICFKAALTSTTNENKKPSTKTFWLFLTFFLLALGINKQLDLQTLLTQIGRDLTIEQGWYKDRRTIQMGFIILIGLLGLTGTTILLRAYRNADMAIKITFSGCIILFIFILVRASSFHHIEIFINLKLDGTRMNVLLELGGLAIIGLGGFRYFYSKKN